MNFWIARQKNKAIERFINYQDINNVKTFSLQLLQIEGESCPRRQSSPSGHRHHQNQLQLWYRIIKRDMLIAGPWFVSKFENFEISTIATPASQNLQRWSQWMKLEFSHIFNNDEIILVHFWDRNSNNAAISYIIIMDVTTGIIPAGWHCCVFKIIDS